MTDRIDDAPLDDVLVERFARLDRVPAPEIWERIERQASTGPDHEREVRSPGRLPGRLPGRSPGRRRGLAAAAAALLIVGGVAAVAATRDSDDRAMTADGDGTSSPSVATPEPAPTSPSTSPAADGDEGGPAAGAPDEIVVEMPVVEGLDEVSAVETLRSLDLVVSVERIELPVDDPAAGRVVRQRPAAATQMQAFDVATIVIGQPTRSAGDPASADDLGRTLADLEVDLASAPVEARVLGGARFCGSERTGSEGMFSPDIDVEGRRCLLDHHAARLPGVFVSEFETGAASRIVVVYRTDADGRASTWINDIPNVGPTDGWTTSECRPFFDVSSPITPPVSVLCSNGPQPPSESIDVAPLAFPDWFADRTDAPTCGYFSPRAVADPADLDDLDDLAGAGAGAGIAAGVGALDCMATAIAEGERGELVTVHHGDDLRIARWIVALGPSPSGSHQFEVASLVVDLRAETTRWAETRCVEGELVDGRLVGEFIVERDQVDRLDPSGTTVTDSGDVIDLPGPDERGQLQACNGSVLVERPFVTPFEATGLRTGDEPPSAVRFPSVNEVGAIDLTIEPSWWPAGIVDVDGIVGFAPTASLDLPLDPSDLEFDDRFLVVYADDGVTRIGEFADGGLVLD